MSKKTVRKLKPGTRSLERANAQYIRELTDGLFSSIIDTTLFWLLLFPTASIGKKGSLYNSFSIVEEAGYLQEEINFKKFKNALRKLREKGLIQRFRDWGALQIATQRGSTRLRSLVPMYDEERSWDGVLYLIQYDISREQSHIRNILREKVLKKLAAIKLQDSSYLLFMNPKGLVDKFIRKWENFEGSILISKLTKDAFLTKESIKEYIWRKGKLDMINARYKKFISLYKGKTKIQTQKACMEFLSIVKDDPQVPFELLRGEYKGDKAYVIFLQHVKDTPFYMHVIEK